MIVALDSATPPTRAQVQAADAGGIRLWNGYLATKPNVGLLHPWAQADFDAARIRDALPIAYVSGWDDPAAVKALAAAWRVRPCLDVESEIRGDGPWVQGWLDASGAGLYGNLAVHRGRHAPFHVLSWYVGDPGATWCAQERPNAPCGWQWLNSHDEFGVEVDRCYFDDWFEQGEDKMTEQEKRAWVRGVYAEMGRPTIDADPKQAEADIEHWVGELKDDRSNLDDVLDQIRSSPDYIAYQKRLAAALTPAGVDIATLAAAVAAHLKIQPE